MTKSLSRTSLILLTLALGLGTFIQILDLSIANVSISAIAGDLDVSVNEGTWVITSFAISNAIVLALTGWLSVRFGNVRLFIWSTALFSLMSWLCGLSWSLSTLVFFRVLQGASAGVLIPISQTLLMLHYPQDKKGLALGFWAMIVVLAPIIGPIIGGYITEKYGWPWIFYINVPIGFFSGWLAWKIIGEEMDEIHHQNIDIVGLILLILAIGGLQILLDKGTELGWLNSQLIRFLLILSGLSFLFFIMWNPFSQHPIINFALFRDRSFVLSTFLASLGFLLFFGTNVLLPLWLQTQMNYTPFWAGIAVMPVGFIPLFFSPFVGHIVGRIDPRLMTTFSFLCFSLTFFYFSSLTPSVTLQHIMFLRFIQGLALAFFFIPLITVALAWIPKEHLADASGVFNFIRLVAGGGVGTALCITLWNQRTNFHFLRITESLSDQSLNQLRSFIPNDLSDQVLPIMKTMIAKQASLLAINDIFWLAAWIFLLSIPIAWVSKPAMQKLYPNNQGFD